ncbi:MAG: DUF4422 domain-containing protein [Eggerthellaceae bacterium]|nr:DUF4422 domain-containing protein [Eggerthellaceae bacterium]
MINIVKKLKDVASQATKSGVDAAAGADVPTVVIAVSCHKPTAIPKAGAYLPIHVGAALALEAIASMQPDDEGDNISMRNPRFCELTAQYWAWKHIEAEYIGLCHYRRYFCFDDLDHESNDHAQIEVVDLTPEAASEYRLDDDALITQTVQKYDMIIPNEWDVRGVYTPKGPKRTVAKHMIAYGLVTKDILKALDKAVAKRQRAYRKDLSDYLCGTTYIGYNCFIARRDLFDELCAFEFDILDALDESFDFSNDPENGERVFGYLGEILFSTFVLHLARTGKANIGEYPLVFFEYTYGEEELAALLENGPIVHEKDEPGAIARVKEHLLPYGSKRRAAANTVRGLFRR